MFITLDDAVTRLIKGDLVALPSETVYGLAGLALNLESVQKIFTLKGRPATNPLIVHVAGLEQAEKLCKVNNLARKAASAFWPGPLTLVLPKRPCVPDLVTAGNQTVAIRVPKHPIFLEILNRLNQPLAAPSANPSNRTSPTQASHLPELFGYNCPPTVDGGNSEVGLESTVLDLSSSQPTLLRPGVVTRIEIEKVLGIEVFLAEKEENTSRKIFENGSNRSPGMNPVHYAPITPLNLFYNIEELLHSEIFSVSDLVIVTNQKDLKYLQEKGIKARSLAHDNCPTTIARNLYRMLIELDSMGLPKMHLVFPMKSSGVNRAILDRLTRAALPR